MMPPDTTEIRVLGALIEKQRTTPDAYPLTLNSLRLACNQSTNREPVVDYDEATIRAALGELGRRGWIRSAGGHTSRSAKYRHLLEAELGLDGDELSLLGVLMLRGAQTPGQLKQRAERLHHFPDLGAVHEVLDRLIERELVSRLPRRPGQKEERFRQEVGGEQPGPDGAADAAGRRPGSGASEHRYGSGPSASEGLSGPADAGGAGARDAAAGAGGPGTGPEAPRIDRLERELAELKRELAELRALIDG